MRVYPRRVAEKRLERGSHHDAHGNRRSSESRADPANQRTRKSSSVGRREMRPNLRYRRQHVSTGLDRAAERHALRLRERVLQAIAVSLRASQLLQRYSHFKVSSYPSSPRLHAAPCSIRLLPGRTKNPRLPAIRKQRCRRSKRFIGRIIVIGTNYRATFLRRAAAKTRAFARRNRTIRSPEYAHRLER